MDKKAIKSVKYLDGSEKRVLPEEKQFDFVTLDDGINLKGRQIVKFSYKDTETGS